MNKKDDFNVDDQRTLPFTTIENDIIDSMSFEKPIDKLLYITLSRFGHMKRIFPSIGKLMLMVGVGSENTLKAALERLEAMKLIKVKNRGRDQNGEHKTHQYVLLQVPNEIRENSAFDDDKTKEVKKEIKEKRKEKAAKSKKKTPKKPAKTGDKKGASKIDVPPSKNDIPPSKFDVPPSKFDDDELRGYELRGYKQEFKNINLSTKEIEKLEIPAELKTVLKEKTDRLIDLNISLEQVYLNYLQYKDDYSTSKYINALAFSLNESHINDFDALMNTNITFKPKNAKNSQNGQNKAHAEVIPEWFKNRETKSEEPKKETSPEEQADLAERIRKLSSAK